MISIVFYQYANVAGAAHPNNSCHAVTIDLKTAEALALSDFIGSQADLEKSVADGKYEVIYGGLKTFTTEGILGVIRTSLERVTVDRNTQNFYISDGGKICIIIDLPHGGGGYSVVKIG